jgi:methylated-DNA-[protein]-cysteine S-methyltransferase
MITAYLNEYTSPLGTMILASNGTGLCGAWFEGQAHFEENLPLRLGAPHASLDELHLAQGSEAHYDRIISCVRTWLDLYFTGEDPGHFRLLTSMEPTSKRRCGLSSLAYPMVAAPVMESLLSRYKKDGMTIAGYLHAL